MPYAIHQVFLTENKTRDSTEDKDKKAPLKTYNKSKGLYSALENKHMLN